MYTVDYDHFSIDLEQDAIDAIARPGPNDADVAHVAGLDYVKAQTDKIPPETLRRHLTEYGAWDDAELADHVQNVRRLIWLAAWDAFEEQGAEE